LISPEERIRLTSVIRSFVKVRRKMRCVGYVSMYVKKRAAYQVLVGKSDGKIPNTTWKTYSQVGR
jgi:hypothetical protein